MSLDSALTAVVYDALTGPAQQYPVGFRYLDPSHVHVALMAQGTGTVAVAAGVVTFSNPQPTLVIGSRLRVDHAVYHIATRASDVSFTLTTRPVIAESAFHLPDDAVELNNDTQFTLTGGASPAVTVIDAVPSTTKIVVFRRTPLVQPTVLPLAGALPAPALEGMADRLMMIVQEQQTGFDGTGAGIAVGNGELLRDTAIFENAAQRAAPEFKPKRRGQLGVQMDDRSVWISSSTAVNSWVKYVPEIPPPVMDDRLSLGFAGDTGEQSVFQTQLATRLESLAPDYVVFCGDNSYGGESEFNDDWAAFDAWITGAHAGRALPVLGNHDIDGPSTYALHTAKFSYLPGNRRYWNKVLGNGLVEIFVLHSGRNTAWSLIEPDGNAVGSVQHTWFVNALRASTARWKLVFFHHPPITSEDDVHTAEPAMDWPEFAAVDGVFCGHAHLTEWLTLRGTPVINCSRAVKSDGTCSFNLYGAATASSSLVWSCDNRRLVARLQVTPGDLMVQFYDMNSGVMLYQRSLTDKTLAQHEWGLEVVAPGVPVAVQSYFVGLSPSGMIVHEWFIGVETSGSSALQGYITVGEEGTLYAGFTIPAGQKFVVAPSLPNMPLGSRVDIVIEANASYPAWTGLQVYARGRIII
jgi:hypothetical protein